MSEFFARSAVDVVVRMLESGEPVESIITRLQQFQAADQVMARDPDRYSRPMSLALTFLQQGVSVVDVISRLQDLCGLEELF